MIDQETVRWLLSSRELAYLLWPMYMLLVVQVLRLVLSLWRSRGADSGDMESGNTESGDTASSRDRLLVQNLVAAVKPELVKIHGRLDGLETRFDGLENRTNGILSQVADIKVALERKMERSEFGYRKRKD